jgi:hypothetical protein
MRQPTREPQRNCVPLYDGCGVASFQVSRQGIEVIVKAVVLLDDDHNVIDFAKTQPVADGFTVTC